MLHEGVQHVSVNVKYGRQEALRAGGWLSRLQLPALLEQRSAGRDVRVFVRKLFRLITIFL